MPGSSGLREEVAKGRGRSEQGLGRHHWRTFCSQQQHRTSLLIASTFFTLGRSRLSTKQNSTRVSSKPWGGHRERSAGSADLGCLPEPVRNVLQRLKERAGAGVDAMDTQKVGGDTPRNHDQAFLQMSWAAEAADRATRDYRSVFNAYTHKFHQPKLPIGELAAM